VFHEAKLITARFYVEHVLPRAAGLLRSIQHGGVSTMALTEEQF
jgi:acyl-CoA dehydrogenase